MNFVKFPRTPFLTEQLWWLLLVFSFCDIYLEARKAIAGLKDASVPVKSLAGLDKTNFWYKRRVFQNMGVYSLVNCEKIE